jgi:hypothetical protein
MMLTRMDHMVYLSDLKGQELAMALAQWRQMPHFWNGKCNLWKQIKKKISSKFV